MRTQDLTKGNVTVTMVLFAAPMILGNLLQQGYNFADTWIVGRYIGAEALGAVGSAYALMTFLTSIIIGLCMGNGALISYSVGQGEEQQVQSRVHISFAFIGVVSVLLTVLVTVAISPILRLLQTPPELMALMHEYTSIVFTGILFVFLYNYFAFLLRSVGDSFTPLLFLGVAAVLNILLDLLFVLRLGMGVGGAAWATVLSQAVCGVGLAVYTWVTRPQFRLHRRGFVFTASALGEVAYHSSAASVQQSVMNFGILMVQGLVNSFGVSVMSAFAAAVKIDTLAYMPAQEFGNAYSLFVSQNYGAGKHERIKKGTRSAAVVSMLFCALLSAGIVWFAEPLMGIFISAQEQQIIAIGARYLRIEGAFYIGIGLLFLLYGYYRGINRPHMSLVLTAISLGTRVLLAYLLSSVPAVGVAGIWWAIPIGWLLADLVGFACFRPSFRAVEPLGK